MTRQTLYKVIKLSTSTISRSLKKKTIIDENGDKKKEPIYPITYDLGEYSFFKAESKEEIVDIGDNLVFRKIREYYGNIKNPNDIYDEITEFKKQISDLKNTTKTNETKFKILELEKQILDIIYVKDIINVKVINKDHYKDIALNGFIVNGTKYKRLCCGSGQMRRNTVTFVNENLFDYLNESLMCGLNGHIGKITLAKLSAYYALSFSSVLWVRKPRICVIPDIETTLPKQKIDFIVKNEDGSKDIEERIMDVTLNSCDGEGLISPECAEWFSQDMGLDYTCCQFVVRTAFIKGCLLTFDFKTYLKEVCGTSKIKSIYGEEFNIDEIDVLLTESMFKMHKHYKSVREYVDFHNKYNLHWGIARYNKKFDDDYSLLNYQYIQNNNLNDNNIKNLISPTVNWFKKICSGDKFYSIMYSIGCKQEEDSFEDIFNNCGSLHTKAIIQNSIMLQDGYIKRKIYNSIKESFRQAKIGRIWCRGGYQFMLADPIPLLRNAVGLDPKGLIPANHVYSAYWNKCKPEEIDLCRSPMVDRHEHNISKLAQNSEMDKWYQYLYSGIVYSIYDTSTIRHSDSDFDGDIVFSTDNINLIKGAYRENNPITYDKEKAPDKEITYENIIDCDMDGFDTLVGQITNNSTSLNAMLPLFPKTKKHYEHNEVLKRLKLLREIIGAEIDKIKLGVSPEFPKEWIEREKIDKENDTQEEINKKMIRNSLVICKKPYFMIYLYDKLNSAYRNHVKQFNLDCKARYNMSYNDLKYKKKKTDEEIHFVNKGNYFSPVLDTPCVMNKICHKIERLESEISYDKSFSNSVLPLFNKKQFTIDNDNILLLEQYYKEYKAQKKFTFIKKILNDIYTKDEFAEYLNTMNNNLIKEYRTKCYNISTNNEELFEYMITLSEKISNFDYTFIWDIFSDEILKIIPKENSIIYKESENGQEYLGRKYEVMEVQYLNDNLG